MTWKKQIREAENVYANERSKETPHRRLERRPDLYVRDGPEGSTEAGREKMKDVYVEINGTVCNPASENEMEIQFTEPLKATFLYAEQDRDDPDKINVYADTALGLIRLNPKPGSRLHEFAVARL